MNNEIEHKIESYLGGNLSAEDVLAFEALIEADSELRKAVLLSKEITHHLNEDFSQAPIPENEHTEAYKDYLKSDDAKQIKNKLREIQHEFEMPEQSHPFKRYLFAVAAISILVLGTAVFLNFNRSSPEKLYASYYDSQDLPSVIKRDNQDSDIIKGVLAFQQNDYTTALQYFNSYKINELELDPSVYIYAGLAHLQENNLEDAMVEFDKLTSSNALDYSKGYWFKALAYLKIGDSEKAKEVIQEIIKDPSNFNYEEAKELFELL